MPWMWGMTIPKKTTFGCDVSHHQGNISWEKVSKDPSGQFAFIKASTGVGSRDSKVDYNAKEAKKWGIKIGYYHFASLNETNVIADAANEAHWFSSVVDTLPVPDLPLILDIELDDPKIHLTPDDVLKWINSFFFTLHQNGYTDYAIYSYLSFLDTHLPANHNLGGVRLWIAQYTSKPEPKLPRGWKTYWMWQYSDKGKINGIIGNVDVNKTTSL